MINWGFVGLVAFVVGVLLLDAICCVELVWLMRDASIDEGLEDDPEWFFEREDYWQW